MTLNHLAMVLLLAALAAFLYNRHRFGRYLRREGVVDHYDESVTDSESVSETGSSSVETTLYLPVVRYEVDGTEYFFHSKTGITSRRWAPGSTVRLLVNPRAPHRVVMDHWSDKHLASLVLAVLAVITLLLGTLL